MYRALALCLFVSVFAYASAQHASLGTNISTAPEVLLHMTATVTDGTENYFQIHAEHLPATVYYWPDSVLGPLPMLMEVKEVDDTLSATMVAEGCRMGWKWELAEAVEEEDDVHYFYFSARENNAIAEILPTCRETSSEESLEVCDSLLWNEVWRKETGDYEFRTTNAAGCDSTAVLHLTVHHSVTVTLNDTAVCDEIIYQLGDLMIEEEGTYTIHLETAFGCDSAVTQTVRFLELSEGFGTVTAYDSYTTTEGETFTTSRENGGPMNYYTNALGCDSIVTIKLFIRHLQVNDTVSQTVCASELPFEWYGQSYNESGLYTSDTILGEPEGGVYMDTLHTVNLTVLPVSTGDTTVTACESFEWYGTTYNESAEPTHTFTNSVGCDSVVTLHLTIHHANTGDTTATACESFEWYGTTYSESGEATHTFTNQLGCDSVVTLHLTIHHANTGDTTATACESFEWYGQTYEQSGEFTHNTKNSHGCDSTVTLHLTIYHATSGEESRTENNSYIWHGKTYTESGDYTYETKNSHGCDSTATLHLTIVKIDYEYDTVYFCQGFNTEHEELITDNLVRRYRTYVYESPAGWDYQEGLILAQQDHRMQLDLRQVEQNLEAHYTGALEPVKLIQWTFVKKGETMIEMLQSEAEPVWKDFGRLTIEVRFTCGHVFSETIPVGSTEDIEDTEADQTTVRKVLKDGQIYILRGQTKYSIVGLPMAE